MNLKEIIDEDFVNYYKPSMLIATCYCNWKCCIEDARCKCQNSKMSEAPIVKYDNEKLVKRFLQNPLSEAIVFGGLEPMLQFAEILDFIELFRKSSQSDIVIYTGYYKHELVKEIEQLSAYPNIVIKFGRYRCDQTQHYDPVLGITLANAEQHAERIS